MMSLKKKKRNLWKVFLHKEITRHMRKLSRLLYCSCFPRAFRDPSSSSAQKQPVKKKKSTREHNKRRYNNNHGEKVHAFDVSRLLNFAVADFLFF